MSAEEVKIGSFQVALVFLLGVNYIIVSMNHALPNFHSYTPKFHCKVKGSINSTNTCVTPLEISTTNSSTALVSENEVEYSSCETGYRFDSIRGETTIVTEWGLICERRYLLSLSTSFYFYGVVIGAWISGVLADRVGRLPVLAMCLYTQGTLAVALYIIQDYRAFLVVRALQGVFVQGLQISTYTLLLELFPVRARTLVGMTLQFSWAIGLVLLAGLSYAVADWRVLQLATSVPTAITVLYIWIIPESPRWLLAKGKLTEAHMALEKITKYNTCCIKSKVEVEVEVEEVNATTIAENVTPVKPKRKSRISNVDLNETKTTDGLPEETGNLSTTPENSEDKLIINEQQNHMLASSESLERRISNLEIQLGVDMFRDQPKEENQSSTPPPESPYPNEQVYPSKNESEQNQEVLPDVVDEIVELRPAEEVPKKKEEDVSVPKEKKSEDIERKSEVIANQNFLQFLKPLKLRRNCVVIIFIWFSVALSYNGLMFHMPNICDDRHANFAIGAFLDIIAYAIAYFVLIKFERRIPLCIYLILSGTICMIVAAISMPVHENAFWTKPTKLTLVLLGKEGIVSSFAIIYLYTIEMVPTIFRGTGLGFCEIVHKVGSLIASQILIWGVKTSVAVPISIMGTLCVIAGILSLSLPKTLRNSLPDTIQQCENLFNKNNSECPVEEKMSKKSNKKRNTILDEQNERDILREKLFSDENGGKTWVDAGNGIIVNFSDSKNTE